MRVVIIWRDNEDYSRDVSEWLFELERRTGKTLESLTPDDGDGESLSRVYDVVEYPTILAIDDDGRLQSMWRGRALPLINDVEYYLLDH